MITDERLRAMANQYVDSHFRIKAIKGEQPFFYDVARAYERGYRVAEQANSNMGKCVEFSDKAEERQAKADYWAKRTDTINLSMPESIDFYEHKLEVAKEYHEGVKSGKYPRSHSYTLTYAKKDVNEMQKSYDLAVRLWGEV